MTALLCLNTRTGRLSRYKRSTKSVEGFAGVTCTHRVQIPDWSRHLAGTLVLDAASLEEFRRYPERVFERAGLVA